MFVVFDIYSFFSNFILIDPYVEILTKYGLHSKP